MAEVFDLRALVSADVSPFEKAMDSSANSVTSSLSLINTAANAYIGSGFIRTLIKATNTAYEFEQVMADISSISSVNTDKMASSIRGLDNVYGKLSDVANSAYEIISSGFDKSSDEVLHFQKTISATAKTIRADIDATTNAMTTLANAYGIPIDQVQKISDMLFVTVREGKAQGNELARTLGLVTNTAAEAGVTLAEMAATISILSRTQSSSQSMIGFNQMLNSLIKPTQEAQREAKKWGIEIGAAALQSKGFTAILTELHDKIGGNVEAINAILGNIRAMRAGTALTGRQFENFIKVLREAEKEIGSGASLEAFAKQTDTAQQSLKNLEVQFDKTMEGVGKDFEPISKNLIELSEQFLKNFSDTDPVFRWSTYLTAILFTFRSIKAVVKTTSAYMQNLSSSGVVGSSKGDVLNRTDALYSGRIETQKTYLADATAHYNELANREISTIKSIYESERTKLVDYQKVLQTRLTDERRYASDMREYYREQIEAQRKHIASINKQAAELGAAYKSNLAKRASMDEWQYAGSGAILSAHYMDVSNKASGSRSLYSVRMTKELSDATEQYLAMVTAPDINAVLQKRLNPTKSTIVSTATKNIESMYHITRDKEGNIVDTVDPYSGKFVDYDKILKAEIKRVSGAYRDARLKHMSMENTQTEGFSKYAKDKASIDAEIAQQKATLESLRKANDESVAALNSSVKIAKEEAQLSRGRVIAIEDESSAAKKSFNARSKALEAEREAIEKERKDNIRNVRARAKARIAELEAQRDALRGSYKHERRHLMDRERRALLVARYNRRYGTNLSDYDIINQHAKRKMRATAASISRGLSKTANALATVPAAISAWTVGWDIGESIGKHLKLADSEIMKAVAKWKIWNAIPGFGNLNLDGRKDPSAVEDDLIKKNRDINSKLLMRLKREGRLNDTAYQLELQQVALAKTLKDLTDQYSRLIKDIKPNTPKAQSHADIENEAKTNAEQILSSKPLTEAQRTEIIKSVKAHNKPLEQATKSQKFRTITGEKDLLAGLITEQDLLALASAKNVNEIEKMITDLINRADNMTYSPTADFQMRLGTESTKEHITDIKTEYGLALRRIIQKIAYDVRDITFVDDAERVKLRKALVNESMESAANKDATRAGNEYDKHIKAAEVADAERRATSDYRYAYRYRGIDTYGLNAATASSTTAMLNQDKAFEEKLDAYLELKASGDLLIGGKRVGDTDKWKGKLVTSYNALMAEEKKLREAINASVDGSLSYIRDVLEALTSEGLAEDSAEYARRSTVEIQREISRLQDLANRSTTDYGKRKIRSAIATHKKTLNDIVDKQTVKMSEMYKGIFGSMQDSLTQYTKDMTHLEVGRMTNNQLFHNLNMMSRITGPSLIQRGLIPVTARNNVRYRDTQSRVKAEQQVFSAIDSYIMSKKYEDANIGKTVTNIYDYIRDNNKIMVSR